MYLLIILLKMIRNFSKINRARSLLKNQIVLNPQSFFVSQNLDKRSYGLSTILVELDPLLYGSSALLGAAAYASTIYKVAGPDEYLVRTGIFIDDIDISKKAFHLPYQTLTRLNISPKTYPCLIEDAMSIERISFNMPAVFTIGPKDASESLKIYAKLLLGVSPEDLESEILGIIQGEIRLAAGRVSLDDLFNNREEFKEKITDEIKKQLAVFGLDIYNLNIKELTDTKGNEYFVFMRKRALEGAVNKAKVDVAEQNKIGDVGERMHVTEKRQKIAEFEKQAKLIENERDRDIAESETALNIAKAEFKRQQEIAEAQSDAGAEIKKLELQKQVEEQRNKQNMEKLRASEFTVANVKAEVKVKEAEGTANAMKLEAEGKAAAIRLEAQANADAMMMQANAEAESMKMKAQASYIEKENEAKGILKLREAEAEGLEKLIPSAGGVENLNKYLIIKENILSKLAEEQANAIYGMKPNINILQTGSKSDDVNGASNVINDLVTNAVPLFEAIKNQYGIDPLKTFRNTEKM